MGIYPINFKMLVHPPTSRGFDRGIQGSWLLRHLEAQIESELGPAVKAAGSRDGVIIDHN